MNDTQRLDWLEQNAWGPNPRFHYGNLECNLDLPWTKPDTSDATDLRSAIDEMMRKEGAYD